MIITVDTTRPDHLGTYGYRRNTSPAIDSLAAESVRFDQAYAHVPITLPSHTSLFTGTVPVFHGVRDNGRFVVRESLVTLAEMMQEAGYATAAFVSAFVLDSRFGLDQGFAHYDDEYSADWSEEDIRSARLYSTMITERSAEQTTDRALAWLEAAGDEPFFVWVHYYDPHQRYRPPQPYASMFSGDPYDGEIAYMDSQLGRLLDRLRARPRWDEALVILASDHGESLGQHGEPTHAVLTYDSTLRVALLVKPPRSAGIEAGVASRIVSLRDVLPTVAELLRLEAPPQAQGNPLLGGEDDRLWRERPIYFECLLPRLGYGWSPLFGLRGEGWKYIHGPEPELYRVAGDADELVDLAAREQGVRERYEELLFSVIESEGAAPELLAAGGSLDPEARAKLAALGYVGGGEVAASELTPREPTGRADPRRAVALLGDYFLANNAAARGQYELAAHLYETILLPLDPGNPNFLTSLGDVRRSLGDLDAAFNAYRRAQAVDPQNATIFAELGRLEMDRGRLEAAEDLLQAARQLAPEDVSAAYALARVAQRRELHELAVERFRDALALDDSHHDSRVQLAVELGRLGRLEEARGELLLVLAAAPFFSRAHYNLGIVELRSDRVDAAVAALGRALRYRPSYVEARYALGVAKARAGDPAGAREVLETLLDEHPESDQSAAARRLLGGLDGDD